MKYLIRNGHSYPVSSYRSSYRGTDRNGPIYCDALPKEHEVNRLFTWYLQETEQSEFVQDLDTARRYVELCNLHFPTKRFDIIGIAESNGISDNSAQFLGHDISLDGGASLIFLALLEPPGEEVPKEPIQVLNHLIRKHFFSKLNEFGLFRTFEDASHCRSAMVALQSFRSNLYEGGNLDDFRVIGIYMIS
jgi:hypothetical protein